MDFNRVWVSSLIAILFTVRRLTQISLWLYEYASFSACSLPSVLLPNFRGFILQEALEQSGVAILWV